MLASELVTQLTEEINRRGDRPVFIVLPVDDRYPVRLLDEEPETILILTWNDDEFINHEEVA